jgi:ribonuclease P/MRP protein subunit RPP40
VVKQHRIPDPQHCIYLLTIKIGFTSSDECVTRTLKSAAQCGKAARTGQTVLGQLSRAFHYRDSHVFLKLYIQYVRPHLEFASPAWAPWMEGDKESMEKVQRRAISMISGLRFQQYEEKLRELGLCTLEERRHQLDMTQTFKILKKGVDNVT